MASLILADDAAPGHSVPGIIAARREVVLGFQTLGRIAARDVDVGAVVRQGELLAALDPEDLQGDVRAAQAAADAAEVELRTVRAATGRTQALAQRNVASTAQLEQAERELAAAEATSQQARSQLIRARDAAGFARMTAPFDGVISAVFANAGAIVSAGEPVLTLSAQDGTEAVIDLPDAVAAAVELDDPYEIWSEMEPELLLPARVARIYPVADAATRTRRIHLALADGSPFRLGALIRARPARPAVARLMLPQSAILGGEGGARVWLIRREGGRATASLRAVTTLGPAVNGLIAITAGLQPGDEVAIRGIHSLAEGQEVGRSVTP
ncbi:efflux RND transporter periplasmic adaptor subunit [Paracoccus sp. (in: a-proteobacteria)]|uniref:efflux RND transporter periplasmic adaptor subunit n=1 Tax=Paracoccus sp. TaxID=267 RepID=UPI00321F66FF